MKITSPILTAVALFAVAGTGFAQESDVVQMDEAVLKAETVKRDAIIETFTPEDVERKQIDDFDDIVRLLPGITVSKGDERWGSSGFNIRGLDEDRVGINVDGLSQGETLKYETGQAYGYFKGSRNGVDIESLKAIEVVKGADSIISGSGALAGAVNFTTKDAADYLNASGNDAYFSAKVGYASINDETMGTATAAARAGRVEALVVYTNRQGHEYENFDMDGADVEGSAREIPDPQETELNSLLTKLGYVFRPGHRIDFIYSSYDSNRVTDSQSFNGSWYQSRVGNDTSENIRYGLLYAYEGETPLFDAMRASVDRQEVDFAAHTTQDVLIQFGATPSTDETREDIRAFNQHLTKGALEFEKAVVLGSQTHALLYGAEYYDKDFENSQRRLSNSNLNDLGWVERNLGALIPASSAEIFTIYALDSIELGEKTTVRIGGRYDQYTYDAYSDENYDDGTGTLGEVDFSSGNGTVGFDRGLTDTLTLSAGVATGFRAPTIEEMYSTSGSVDDWSTVANPDLKAESVVNYDVAVTGVYDRGTFRLGAYFSKYNDFIDREARTGINPNTGVEDPNGFNVPVNVDGVEVKGVEFSGYLNLSRTFGWSCDRAGRLLGGRAGQWRPALHHPAVQLHGRPRLHAARGALGVESLPHLHRRKIGRRLLHDRGRRHAHLPALPEQRGGRAGFFDLLQPHAQRPPSVGVYNLTDKEYYNWDSVRFVDQGDLRPGIGVTGNGVRRYSEAGRNIKIDFRFQF